MSAKDDVKNALGTLMGETGPLLENIGEDLESVSRFLTGYQRWYTKALKIVAALAPDRLHEFREIYEPDPKRRSLTSITYRIRDYVQGIKPTKNSSGNPLWNLENRLRRLLVVQITILGSLDSRIDGVLADVEAAIASELEDSTLATAARLARVSPRAAGALAGVILEEHLQRLATSRAVPISKSSPTISDLNEPLKVAQVYDLATWRRIQHLADIRNLSVHKKGSDPTIEQIEDMLSGVSWVVKNTP